MGKDQRHEWRETRQALCLPMPSQIVLTVISFTAEFRIRIFNLAGCLSKANFRASLKSMVYSCADIREVAMIFIPIMYRSTIRYIACGRNCHYCVLLEISLTRLAKLPRRNDSAVILN